jgi:VanZ family protein
VLDPTTAFTPAPAPGEARWRSAGGVGWALLAAALLLYLFMGDAPERTLLWDAAFDVGHVPLFGLLALAALRLLRVRRPGMPAGRAWWSAFGLTVAIGAATELIQFSQPNREPSVGDFARDTAGAGAFLLAAAVSPRLGGGGAPPFSRTRGRRSALIVAGVLLAISGAQLAATLAVLAGRDAAMPTLVRFDGAWWERPLVRPGHSRLTPGARPGGLPPGFGEPLVRMDLQMATYPGVSVREPHPDWRGYRRLVFTVVSDLDAPTVLTLRVHDALHDQRYEDRFNRGLKILPGVNRVVIPLDDIRTAPDGRDMDMSRIRGIAIFGHSPAAPTHVFLGPLRLE